MAPRRRRVELDARERAGIKLWRRFKREHAAAKTFAEERRLLVEFCSRLKPRDDDNERRSSTTCPKKS